MKNKITLILITLIGFSAYSQGNINQEIEDLKELKTRAIIVYGGDNAITDDIGDALQSLMRIHWDMYCQPQDTSITHNVSGINAPQDVRTFLTAYEVTANNNVEMYLNVPTCKPVLFNQIVIWHIARYITAVTDAANYN